MEKEKTKISVIIPAYNVEKYLEECLDSVLKQGLENIEIIIINDGSTDKTEQIAKKYSQKYKNIILISQENQGQSVARNLGVAKARGEYIFFLDSDDYLENNVFECLYEAAINNNLDVVVFDACSFGEGKIDNITMDIQYERKCEYGTVTSGKKLFQAMNENGDYRTPVWMMLIKRTFLKKENILFYNGIIHEDDLYTLEVYLKAERILHINKIFYNRRVHLGSTMTEINYEKKILGYYTTIKVFLERYKKCLEKEEYGLDFFQRLYTLLWIVVCMMGKLEKSKKKIWEAKVKELVYEFRDLKCKKRNLIVESFVVTPQISYFLSDSRSLIKRVISK